jgi:hypothetical protein
MMKQNSFALPRLIPRIRRAFSAIAIVLSFVFALAAFGVQQGTSWTYQGQLQRSGAPYNGTCNFQFSLWDAASAGTQRGNTLSIDSVNVTNGLFTVVLNFTNLFTGEARWLATSVQCSGDGAGFTQLDPRQAITAAPYALGLRPGVTMLGVGGLRVDNTDTSGDTAGVFGRAQGPNSAGVFGYNSQGLAIWGQTDEAGTAIYGQARGSGFAGRFTGPVLIEGNLIVQGALFKNSGSFRIDHPLDPANKFLSHSFVESPDMKNIYDGNVTTDASGSAIVTLPDYFAALNRDCRYQLTVIGQFAQAIVSRKIAGNSFEIRTDKPGVEVSWQVTGIRQDAYAKANPIVVEESKPAEEQGLYLFPAGFGAGEEKQIGYPSRPVAPQLEQKVTK